MQSCILCRVASQMESLLRLIWFWSSLLSCLDEVNEEMGSESKGSVYLNCMHQVFWRINLFFLLKDSFKK